MSCRAYTVAADSELFLQEKRDSTLDFSVCRSERQTTVLISFLVAGRPRCPLEKCDFEVSASGEQSIVCCADV